VRFVVIGAGAIGGVVGAGLHQAGYDVLLVARGAHRDAIAARGLTLETPSTSVTLPIPVTGTAEARAGDVVLLTTKSQDTAAALEQVRADVPVVCIQNGVENERIAARRFSDVYGAMVMAPTTHLEPGVVLAFGSGSFGAIDVGRYPSGVDDRCAAVCEALRAAGFSSGPRDRVMRLKHAKLLTNLANAVEAICGAEAAAGELVERVREEGQAVLQAAGIEFVDDHFDSLRSRGVGGLAEIRGRRRGGGSTWQSVVRGTGSIETDYLNGEIVLRGCQTGVPTPVNALLQQLAHETVTRGLEPGWLTPADVLARLP
jgi:2-dehydropantoate 2-reductase